MILHILCVRLASALRVVYLVPADNPCAAKTRYKAPLSHHDEGALPCCRTMCTCCSVCRRGRSRKRWSGIGEHDHCEGEQVRCASGQSKRPTLSLGTPR